MLERIPEEASAKQKGKLIVREIAFRPFIEAIAARRERGEDVGYVGYVVHPPNEVLDFRWHGGERPY